MLNTTAVPVLTLLLGHMGASTIFYLAVTEHSLLLAILRVRVPLRVKL